MQFPGRRTAISASPETNLKQHSLLLSHAMRKKKKVRRCVLRKFVFARQEHNFTSSLVGRQRRQSGENKERSSGI
jgi:hypothetical protein